MAGEEAGFKAALKSIGDKFEDLSELNIKTYTGKIEHSVAGSTAKEVINNAFGDGELEVVGLTSMKLDGDIDQFISNSEGIDEALYNVHVQSIKTAQATRQAVFELFTGAIKKMIDK